MKNASKRIIAMLLALVMVIGILPFAMAANVGPFEDVDENEWFAEYVEYVYDNDLMNGMTEDTFEPNGNCTRAMAATVLYRIEGEPEVDDDPSFTDLDPDQDWYWDPIAWAEEEGIVNGMGDGKFAPNGLVTREQLLTMIYRYAGEPDFDDDELIDDFDDADDVSDYAVDAFNWGIENGIINGKGDILDPAGNATRAEFAKIISLFDELREEEEDEEPTTKPSDEDEEPTTKPNEDEEPTTKPNEEEPSEKYYAIYNPANSKVMTADASEYNGKNQFAAADATVNADGKLETSATNVPTFKIDTVNGITTFTTADGKYFYMDAKSLNIVDAAGDYTTFILEEADGGNYIRSEKAVYEANGNPQYLEYYAGPNVFTVYGLYEPNAPIYTFTFVELANAPQTPDVPDVPDVPEVPEGYVAIYNPANGKVMTADASVYNGKNQFAAADATINADGKLETSATNVPTFKMETKDGITTFTTADGKYLYMDAKSLDIVAEAGEYTTFVLEEADGGNYIRSEKAVYEANGNPQYLEYYAGPNVFTVYGLYEPNAPIYTFTFVELANAPQTPDVPDVPDVPVNPEIPEGYVAIYNPANGKVMTADASVYNGKNQFAAADATINADGKLVTSATNVPTFKVETNNGITTFTTADGKYLYMDAKSLDIVAEAGEYTTFVLEEADGGNYIRSEKAVYEANGNPQYLEYYAGPNVFTVYGLYEPNAPIYTFTFVELAGAPEVPDTPDVPDVPDVPNPPAPVEGYVAIYNAAKGKVMTGEQSEYNGKKQYAGADASLNAEGKLVTEATNVPTFKVETVDGITTFTTADGKYLYMDDKSIDIVAEAGEYTTFVLEAAEGGQFIRSEKAVYVDKNGVEKPQYIEYYASPNVFTVYSMGSDASIYTFQFVEVSTEAPCAHTNTTEARIDPTCTAAGSIVVSCLDCGKEISKEIIAATGHNVVDGACTVCGYVPGEGPEVVDFASLKDGDKIAIVIHAAVTDADYVLMNNFAANTKVNAEVYSGTFADTMVWTVKIVDGKVTLTNGEVGLYVIDNNNGLRADGKADASVITMADNGYLSVVDPSGNTRYLGVYDNDKGKPFEDGKVPNIRTYKMSADGTFSNIGDQTTVIYKIG